MNSEDRFGTTTFLRLTGLSAPVMRGLEARGILKPIKSDRGWRLFSGADVDAAHEFRRQQTRGRGGRAARGD